MPTKRKLLRLQVRISGKKFKRTSIVAAKIGKNIIAPLQYKGSLLAEKYGHKIIFFPPYSPELNEIENYWFWLKRRLRKTLHDYESFIDALMGCF